MEDTSTLQAKMTRHGIRTGHITAIGVLFLMFLIVSIGCDGEPGVDGVALDYPDFTPPYVRLQQPVLGYVFADSTDTLEIAAYDTLGEIAWVHYDLWWQDNSFVDSASAFGPSSDSLYRFVLDLSEAVEDSGLIRIQVSAADTAGNVTRNPFGFFLRNLNNETL